MKFNNTRGLLLLTLATIAYGHGNGKSCYLCDGRKSVTYNKKTGNISGDTSDLKKGEYEIGEKMYIFGLQTTGTITQVPKSPQLPGYSFILKLENGKKHKCQKRNMARDAYYLMSHREYIEKGVVFEELTDDERDTLFKITLRLLLNHHKLYRPYRSGRWQTSPLERKKDDKVVDGKNKMLLSWGLNGFFDRYSPAIYNLYHHYTYYGNLSNWGCVIDANKYSYLPEHIVNDEKIRKNFLKTLLSDMKQQKREDLTIMLKRELQILNDMGIIEHILDFYPDPMTTQLKNLYFKHNGDRDNQITYNKMAKAPPAMQAYNNGLGEMFVPPQFRFNKADFEALPKDRRIEIQKKQKMAWMELQPFDFMYY